MEVTRSQAKKHLKISNNKGIGHERFLMLQTGAASLICVWTETTLLHYVAVWRSTCWLVRRKESIWKAGGKRQLVVSTEKKTQCGFPLKVSKAEILGFS